MAYPAYEAPLEQIELPEPELVPGTALLEVLTCRICFSDVKTWLGQMPFSDELLFPHVPGHEVVARVVGTDPPHALPTGTKIGRASCRERV